MPSINDNFADAIEVSIATNGGTYTSPSLANTGNTTESGEPTGTDALSMWFKYPPGSSGTATFDTMLSTAITNTDTYMTVFTGTALNNLVAVGTSDDEGGAAGGPAGTSRIADLAVSAGTTYWVQVGGYGNTQVNVVLRVVGPATVQPPPTDFGWGKWLLEDGSGYWTLEDGSGHWLLDTAASDPGGGGTPASASGALTLTGTADARGTGGGSGSLTLTGTAGARGVAGATGSLTLSGTATPRGTVSASGSLTLSGSGEARGAVSASGALTLSGTATASGGGSASGTGSLTLSGAASTASRAAASGALLLSGSAATRAPVSGSGTLTLTGTATIPARASATGSLTLSGTATVGMFVLIQDTLAITDNEGQTYERTEEIADTLGIADNLTANRTSPASATGSLTLSGTASTGARATASGALSLTGTASLNGETATSASGSLSLSGTAGARGAASASGVLTLVGTSTTRAPSGAAGSLSLTGTAGPGPQVLTLGTITLTGLAGAVSQAAASAIGYLELSGYVTLVPAPDLFNPTGSIRVSRVRGTIRPNGTGSLRRDYARARIRT